MRAKAQPENIFRADVEHILYDIVYFTNTKDIDLDMEVLLFPTNECIDRIFELTSI